MTLPDRGSIHIVQPHADGNIVESWINNRRIASLDRNEHGSQTIGEVVRVMELAARELGVFFFR